jgi:putative ABC transport system substrate-binding protein
VYRSTTIREADDEQTMQRLGAARCAADSGRDASVADAESAEEVRRIGYLSAPTRESVAKGVDAFLRKLRDLGWVEGRNLEIEYRWADGNVDRLPTLAADLVQRKVELIVAPAGSAVLAAKQATTRIPIVMIFPTAPVEMKLVASLGHPGGNIPERHSRQARNLRQAAATAEGNDSGISRVAFLGNPSDPEWTLVVREVEEAARSLAIRLQLLEARGPDDFDKAFAAMAREHAGALLVPGGSTFLVHRARLAELALKARLPTMYSFRESVESGGLMAYAVNMADFVGRSAIYVDKILKGARPADLPVEQPTQFELIVNIQTAKALGITVPPSLLQRADTVIE